MTIEIVDLGDWGAATLAAEYDPADDAIRINARAVEKIRRACGDAAAAAFVVAAIAHERHHRDRPDAAEADAHAAALAETSFDPLAFEAMLRA